MKELYFDSYDLILKIQEYLQPYRQNSLTPYVNLKRDVSVIRNKYIHNYFEKYGDFFKENSSKLKDEMSKVSSSKLEYETPKVSLIKGGVRKTKKKRKTIQRKKTKKRQKEK